MSAHAKAQMDHKLCRTSDSSRQYPSTETSVDPLNLPFNSDTLHFCDLTATGKNGDDWLRSGCRSVGMGRLTAACGKGVRSNPAIKSVFRQQKLNYWQLQPVPSPFQGTRNKSLLSHLYNNVQINQERA